MSLTFRFPDKPIETTVDVVHSLCESQWVAQPKYDGWRMPIFFDNSSSVRCLTRAGNPITSRIKFSKEINEAISCLNLPNDTVLDTELIGPRGSHNQAIYILDCLAWNGSWLTSVSYADRWQMCLNLEISNPIYLAKTMTEDFVGHFLSLKKGWKGDLDRYEGIVIKLLAGKLVLDRNKSTKTATMLKLKYRDVRDNRF